MKDYKNSLFNGIDKNIIQNTIISKKLKVYSISSDKLALSNNDDKRYITDNQINALSFGYSGNCYKQL